MSAFTIANHWTYPTQKQNNKEEGEEQNYTKRIPQLRISVTLVVRDTANCQKNYSSNRVDSSDWNGGVVKSKNIIIIK